MDTDFEQDFEGFMSNALEQSWDKLNSEVHEQLPIDFSNPPEQVQNDLLNEEQLIGLIKLEDEEQMFRDVAFPNSIASKTCYNNNQNNTNTFHTSMLRNHKNFQFEEDWMQFVDLFEPAQSLEQLAGMSSSNTSSNELRGNLKFGNQHSRSYSAPMVMAEGCFRDMKYNAGNTYSPVLQNTFPENLFQYGQCSDGFNMQNMLNIQSQTHRRATSDVLPQFHHYGQGQGQGWMDMQLEQMCYKPMHSRSNTNCSDDPSQQTLINHTTISEEGAFYQEHQLVPIMDAGIKEYAQNQHQELQFVKTESPTSVIFPVNQQSMASKQQKSKRGLQDMSPRSRRRVMANRESAKKSRDRKEGYKHEMEMENQDLNKALKFVNKDIQNSTENVELLKQANLALRQKILQLQQVYQINEMVLQQRINKQ